MTYAFEDFTLDIERRELKRAGERVPVEPQIFDLLEYLIRHRERVVGKDDLLDAIWKRRAVSDSAFSSSINAARAAFRTSVHCVAAR